MKEVLLILLILNSYLFSVDFNDEEMKMELEKRLKEKYKDYNKDGCKWLGSYGYYGGGSCRVSLLVPKKKEGEENE